ncbi:MAG: putative toxin-antitoxin system toxin component, PIN family [Candidatus Woesearchaeota archaeon]|nr:putative toxin-antitoxin system toxin component, PIN family [Candidatus Woesearchaeota archaeon]
MRVVLDTNVFISGIFWEGNFCSQIIDKWRKGRFQLVSSPKLVEEFVKALRSFKISMDEELIEEWKNLIIENSVMVDPTTAIKAVNDDPEDDKFVEAAIYGEADFIVSQDKHLLKLKEYNKIRILNPEEAVLIF